MSLRLCLYLSCLFLLLSEGGILFAKGFHIPRALPLLLRRSPRACEAHTVPGNGSFGICIKLR